MTWNKPVVFGTLSQILQDTNEMCNILYNLLLKSYNFNIC
jgi:hypothetical protein